MAWREESPQVHVVVLDPELDIRVARHGLRMHYYLLVAASVTGSLEEPMDKYLHGEYPLKVTTRPDLGVFALFDLIAEHLGAK